MAAKKSTNTALQQKVKVLAKLYESGCKTEKDLKALSLQSILKIPDISVSDMTVITELQEQIAKNRLFSYLGGADDEQKYRDWLLSQPPEEILNHTYEYTMREDIVVCMEELELSPKQAKALLRSPCPLADVYKEFMDREVEHMDTIRDSIETRANDVLKRDKNRESR